MNDIQTVQNKSVVLKPHEDFPLEQLPQKFQDCFDKRKTPDLEYFKIRAKSIGHWCLTAMATFWVLATFISAVSASTVYDQIDNNKLTSDLMWCILPFLTFIFTAYFAIRKEMYVYGIENGERRVGLVIHPEALLVRLKNDSCYLLPKDWLTVVTLQQYAHGKGGRATKLVFTDISGKEHSNIIEFNAYGLFERFDHKENLAEALRRWNPKLEVRG